MACLYSALWLHGLLLSEPSEAWLCIRHKAWKPSVPSTQFFRTTRFPTAADVRHFPQWGLYATSPARTVVDFFRYRRRVGPHAARAVLEIVLQSGECTLADIDACAARYDLKRWRVLDS